VSDDNSKQTTASPCVRFSVDDANAAWDAWGANCGPGAIAAVLGLTLDEVHPHMGDFERKRYTNSTLMWSALDSIGVRWSVSTRRRDWPVFGLARVQWEGPWMLPDVPARAAYRHTHWVGACQGGDATAAIFDINCMSVGGWLPETEWSDQVVPWLLRKTTPRASRGWHITHGRRGTPPPNGRGRPPPRPASWDAGAGPAPRPGSRASAGHTKAGGRPAGGC